MLVSPFQHEELPAHDPKLLFGYPTAQESGAEGAALTIPRALADINARNARSGAPELSARIGSRAALLWSTPRATLRRSAEHCGAGARTSTSII